MTPAPEISEIAFSIPGSRWVYRESPPPPGLSDIVVRFWEYVGDTPADVHKVVPDRCARLILNLGDENGYRKSLPGVFEQPSDIESQPSGSVVKKSWIAGLHDRPLLISPADATDRRATHLVAADLHPWALFLLFGAPADEYCNRVMELSDAVDREFSDAGDRIGEAASTSVRFHLFAEHIVGYRRRQFRRLHDVTENALARITHSQGRARIDDLCSQLDVSRKHLATLFKATVGMTPKRFSRLIKFTATTDALKAPWRLNDSEVAYGLGYADQSHFIKEFSSFAGETPSAFRSQFSSPENAE